MELLVTGGDTELGRVIASGFRDEGHNVLIAGAQRAELEVAAKELDVDYVVFDNNDPGSLEAARGAFPQHLDGIINVPAPRWDAGDPRTHTLTDRASAWRHALDTTVLSAVLTVSVLGDQLSSGGSIINVVASNPADGSADAAIKAALSNWTSGQAAHFGIRGITINLVAAGRGVDPGYDGLGGSPTTTADEITRLALFLTTPSARHITGETLHVSQGALASFG
jgi:NAD(P)-dependent dehydrogenase (short-subunit alcohol dehydrogenase family)